MGLQDESYKEKAIQYRLLLFQITRGCILFFSFFSKAKTISYSFLYNLIWCCEESTDQQAIYGRENPSIYSHQANPKALHLTNALVIYTLCIIFRRWKFNLVWKKGWVEMPMCTIQMREEKKKTMMFLSIPQKPFLSP